MAGRSMRIVGIFVLVASTLGAAPPAADAPQTGSKSAGLPAGHSVHGEAFNEGPRQKAYLMGTTGKVRFPITTNSLLAQQYFDQGVGQLHGFWYFEAERSFRQAAALDPDCAMAYWGMAQANVENEKRARGFIERAVQKTAKASRREQMWIDGLAAYLRADPKNNKQRRRDYIRSLEAVIHEFPDDIEAKAFLAVRLWQFANDWPIPSVQAVDALLDQVFAVEPMHPAHHFRIHIWDYEKPERGLSSAELCGKSAPGIAHMWHMSGHIYSRLRRYHDAAWHQEASARVDHAHLMRDRVLPDQIHNYAHNQEWLIRNLSHVGRVRDALDLAKNLVELPRHPRYNTLSMAGKSASFGRARLFEVLLRYELWDELIQLADTDYLAPTEIPGEQIRRLRALGAARFGKRDATGLAAIVADLQTRRRIFADEQPAAPVKPAARNALSANDADTASKKERDRQLNEQIRAVDNALAELAVYQSLLADDHKLAAERLAKIDDLDKVRLARLYLEAGQSAKAQELARAAVKEAEGEVVPLAQLVEVLCRTGQPGAAGDVFAKLRQISAHIDLDAPLFRRLATIARELKYPSDWRIALPASAVAGDRSALERLGPARWRPTPAADWALPDLSGKSVALRQFRGRAVLVIFYLGFDCPHCVAQLKRFASKAAEFANLRIALVAIGMDKPNVIGKSLEKHGGAAAFPFPLLYDSSRSVFRAYRAYDDFENQALHGTFLIDADGLVRWQDIGFEPFNDVEFVLRESRRLLSHPTGLANSTAGARLVPK
jgi:peroxiredoxin